MTRGVRLVVVGLAAAAVGAFAQDAPSLRARALAATCAQCHGTDGRAVALGAVPGLAGLPAPYLIEQMNTFKNGARGGTVMPQLARGFNDNQIAELAAWFAQVRPIAKRQ
jgi:cytochrome c553